MLRNRSGIAPERLVTSLLTSLEASSSRGTLLDLIPLENQAKPEICAITKAQETNSQTEPVSLGVKEEEDKEEVQVHVGAGQSFVIDDAFDPAFLAKIDAMRQTLPFAPVRCICYTLLRVPYLSDQKSHASLDQLDLPALSFMFNVKETKKSHSLRRYYCDVDGSVSLQIRAVLRAHGLNLSPLSKMRFLEYTSANQVNL